jgi:hypothetical protein
MGLPTIAVPEYSLILPSTEKEIKYRPFLVKEEKLLLIAMESEEATQITTATKNVIKNCVFGDFNVEELPTFDIEYIFLWLRGKAKGEVLDLQYNCPQCKNVVTIKFNIEDVKIKKTEGHTNKIELTDKLGVVLKYPNMDLQQKIESLSSEEHEINKIFKSVLYCVDYIYDDKEMYSSKDHTFDEMEKFLDSLTDTQFQKISSFFETMPKLSHNVQLHCKNKVNKKICG